MKRAPAVVEFLLAPGSLLFAMIADLRGRLFDKGWLKSHRLSVRVLSIGNLTVGGTGKTPLVSFFAAGFSSAGKKVGIVSRGYGGTETGPVLVPKDGLPETASRFGDEPTWLANELNGSSARRPEVAVVVGRDRLAAAASLLKSGVVDLIIADDGFQHRRLQRDCDLVILDATEPRWHYRSLPVGRMREGFSALKRAQVAIISKVNLAAEEQVSWLKQQIKVAAPHVAVFEVRSRVEWLTKLAGGEPLPITLILSGSPYMLLSAIARPEAFRSLVELECRQPASGHLVFSDHHAFSVRDLGEIEVQAHQLGATKIVMTEKDAVKLKNWRPDGLEVYFTQLKVEPADSKGLYETLSRLLF